MKALVTGGSGAVGFRMCEKLVSEGCEADFTYLSHECAIKGAKAHKADVSSKESVPKLSALKPEVVFHSSALTNVDLCETDPGLAHKQNVAATENAISIAKKSNAVLAFVSTSNVFAPSQKAYSESDAPASNPPNNYGESKLEAEKLITASGIDHVIMRIDQPYYWTNPWNKDNTVTRTLKKLRKGESVSEITDWYNSPTFIPAFCNLAYALLKKKLFGTHHAAGPEYLSRYEWGRKTASAFGFDPERIIPTSSASLSLPVKRPNIRLDSSEAYRKAGIKPVSIDEGLAIMKEKEE